METSVRVLKAHLATASTALASSRAHNKSLLALNKSLAAKVADLLTKLALHTAAGFVDLTRHDTAGIAPPPAKVSAVALVSAALDASSVVLKTVKRGKNELAEELEDAHDLDRDLALFSDKKLDEIDALQNLM